MRQTNKLGNNSYVITCTQGTKPVEIIEAIKEVVELRDTLLEEGDLGYYDAPFLHGWEYVGQRTNHVMSGGYTAATAMLFRSMCDDGAYKYLILGANATQIFANIGYGFNEATNWVTLQQYTGSGTHSFNKVARVTAYSHIEIPNDRTDFFLFIHPKWMAWLNIPYSSSAANHYSGGHIIFGLTGIFEKLNPIDLRSNSVMINTGQLLCTPTSHQYDGNGAIGVVDERVFFNVASNRPGMFIRTLGEYGDISIMSSNSAWGNFETNGKRTAKMLTLHRAEGLVSNPRASVSRQEGIVHGLKLIGNSNRDMGAIHIATSSENFILDVNGIPTKHYAVQARVGYINSSATFALPA